MSTIIQEVTERTVQRGSLLYSENDAVNEIVVIKDGQIAKHGAKDDILPQLLGTTSAVDMCSKFNQGGIQ